QAREVSEKRMGQTLPQNATCRLSHGVSFYQAAVDRQGKTPEDGATIGIILCRGKNQTVVEYTLRDAKSPIGVAEYRLLPPKLKAELPETKQLKKLVAETPQPPQSER